jgi:hypothetical protein
MMQQLDREPGAHLSLGNTLVDEANRVIATGSWVDVRDLFARALTEYQSAMNGDASPTEALNLYAYTVWQWQVDWQLYWTDHPEAAPGENLLATAERDAREALKLASSNGGLEDRWTMQSTLGEVLIAQGRYEEARNELKDIVDKRWSDQTETRWDMIAAELCAARLLPAGARPLVSDATKLYRDIESEHVRELPPFSTFRDIWERITAIQCSASPADVGTNAPVEYKLEKTVYAQSPSCEWTMAGMTVYNGNQQEHGLQLRVWGGGINEFRSGEDSELVFLHTPAEETSGRFFASLWSEKGVSNVISFDTHKNCSQGLVKLIFRKSSR